MKREVFRKPATSTRRSAAWAALIADEANWPDIAEALGIEKAAVKDWPCPFKAEPGGSGFLGAAIVILTVKAYAPVFAAGFVKGVGAAAGATTAKVAFDRLRGLWTRTAAPLEKHGVEAIGDRAEKDARLEPPSLDATSPAPPGNRQAPAD